MYPVDARASPSPELCSWANMTFPNVGYTKQILHHRSRSEGPLPADSVEKHRVAGAESKGLNSARAPFLSGFAHVLRCRKDLG